MIGKKRCTGCVGRTSSLYGVQQPIQIFLCSAHTIPPSTYNLSGGCDPAPSHPLFISFSVHALVNQVVNRRNKTANLRLCQLGIRSKLFSLDAHLLIYKR